MTAKESKGRRLTDIEALLILSTNDNLFQTAKRIDEYFEAKSKEEAEEKLVGYVDYMIGLTQYIELLKSECDDMAVIAHVHGWRSDRVEEGKRMRAELNKTAKDLLLPAAFGKEES